MKQSIYINAISSISALGSNQEEIWQNYLTDTHFFTQKKIENHTAWVAQLSEKDKNLIQLIKEENSKYKHLDNSVLFAIFCGRKAIEKAGWGSNDNVGINIGSSRGATSLFEKYYQQFLTEKQTSTLSSPTTTLGNISSWLAHDLQTNGPEISHSITCSTALHSLLNGVAWIQSEMCSKFLVGGSEAPLTAFTIAQMKALKVYAKGTGKYPCLSLDLEKNQNTMILGEGASVICLENKKTANTIASIIGIGYATEVLKHNTSISTNAICFQKSMKMALGTISPDTIDAIIMHAPGTIKGDSSEVNAIKKVFCNNIPFLTTNKWKLGHTFGASGMLSLELALLMLQFQKAINVPFIRTQNLPKKIKKVLVNAVGFGGNAVSVLLTK